MIFLKENTEKVALLGGEGFIGKNLYSILSKNFQCTSLGKTVSKFDNNKNKKSFYMCNPYINEVDHAFDVYIYLLNSKKAINNLISEEKILTNHLNFKKNSHLIFFSSASIYSNPESEYAKRKMLLEFFYKKYCEKNNVNLTILRLFNTYGKYQLPNRQGSLIANIFYNYLNKLPIEINDSTAIRDFIYAEDIGKIVKYIIENKQYGTLDLGTAKPISINELLSIIQENVIREKIYINHKKIKDNSLPHLVSGDLYKKIKLTPLLVGLRKTYNFYKSNLEFFN